MKKYIITGYKDSHDAHYLNEIGSDVNVLCDLFVDGSFKDYIPGTLYEMSHYEKVIFMNSLVGKEIIMERTIPHHPVVLGVNISLVK